MEEPEGSDRSSGETGKCHPSHLKPREREKQKHGGQRDEYGHWRRTPASPAGGVEQMWRSTLIQHLPSNDDADFQQASVL